MGTLLLTVANQAPQGGQPGYAPGLIIAFFLFCYLIYAIAKPEKF